MEFWDRLGEIRDSLTGAAGSVWDTAGDVAGSAWDTAGDAASWGWDTGGDAWNWFTGDDVKIGRPPKAPSLMDDPRMKSYFDAMKTARESSPFSQPMGDPKQGDYYKSLISDIGQREKERGYAAGSSLAARGGRSTGSYGAGRAASTDRADAMDRLRLQAAAQADERQIARRQQSLSEWQTQYGSILGEAKFLASTKTQEFQNALESWFLEQGLSVKAAEANASDWMNWLIGAAGVSIAGYTAAQTL